MPRNNKTVSQADRPLTVTGICVAILALIWFVFGQTIRFPFVNFDDPGYVYELPEINHGLTWHGIVWAFTHFPSPNWYPLTNISHMLEFQLFGLKAGDYHFSNVLLHSVAAILLFVVLRKMTSALWSSAFVAALFAIHPLRVESVAWVIERKDVLSGVFFMLTLAAYVAYIRGCSVWNYLTTLILFACGLMSKPMLVTTPVVLLLLDYWPLHRGRDDRSLPAVAGGVRGVIVEKIPFLVLSLVVTLITSSGIANAGAGGQALPFTWRLANAVVSYVVYIGQMFWPVNLAVWYPHPENTLPVWQVAASSLLLVSITVLAIVMRKTRPYFFVGWFWYVIMLAPVAGVIQVNLQAHADRYTYLPQIGLYIVLAWLLGDLWKTSNAEHRTLNVEPGGAYSKFDVRSSMFGVCFAVIIVVLALTARAQTAYWRDSEALWNRAIAVTKDNAFAHASLADLLLRKGRLDEAIAHCQEALRIRPDNADAHNNLGLALLQKGNESAAAAEFEKCLENDPNHMNAMVNLAWILATSADSSTRNGTKAVQLAENVHRRAGSANVIVLRTLAAAYAENRQFPEAIETAEQAIQLAKLQGNTGLADDLGRNIESYRLGQPLRSGGR